MSRIPVHVAFIMDGNGRWAQVRGLPRHEGHRRGAAVVKKILRVAEKNGIKYVTLFALSSENFLRRSEFEVNFLMNLCEKFLKKYSKTLCEKEVRFRAIGNLSRLPINLQLAIEKLTRSTAHFDRFHLTIALNYGARNEVIRAIGNLLQNKNVDVENLTWKGFEQYLYTKDLPDPDLIIRTSGEQRLSNFLLLQSAYAELYFTKTHWPDFNEKEFLLAIEDYGTRERRMGKTNDKAND
ncbi:MAG: di-trans,poly-cis-decaprenylcistransferase [Puniceicoccales bacterium]|jgi:undecaprenyl diphosphate synthase|nr:di-trans,poly-cis-decaprenylcistransferase [Puniceicoccales bacterium]